MDIQHSQRLKKYLFLISMFFSVLIGIHILYEYLYYESSEAPIEGGNISQWVIWDFPHLNPLLQSTDYNKDVIHLLYRALLWYDSVKQEVVSDLANCDIENLAHIECTLKDDALWSNGEKITPEDVIATYNILKNSDINTSLGNIMKDMTIKNNSWVIVFSNKLKDVNFLNALFQPIVSKNTLDNIWNKELYGNFNPLWGVYSGPYIVETVSYDDSLGIQKLILTKNESYTAKKILIGKYIFKIFKNEGQLLKHADVVNIFFDKNKILGDSIPRLKKVSYTLNQFNALFLNEEKIKSEDLRNFILWKIDVENIIKKLWKWYQASDSLFSNTLAPNYTIKNSNLESIIKNMGFYKKDDLAASIITANKQKLEAQKITNNPLISISAPFKTQYSFSHENEILIEWVVSEKNVTNVYINDYKLAWYKAWDKNFYYRLKTEFQNLHAGDNLYSVYFEIQWKKKKIEDFHIIYSSDAQKLEKLQKEFEERLDSQSELESQWMSEEKKQKILSLSDNAFYDENLQPFSLTLYYLDNNDDLSSVANIIKNTLQSSGIIVNGIPISINDLGKKIAQWEKEYDMILIGIDGGYFPYQILPYFHSSQAKDGYNFSNTKNLNLDLILEELKSNILGKEKLEELEKKVNEIISQKQMVRPLYTKVYHVAIDNNLKNFTLPNQISNSLAVIDSILESYIKSQRTIDFSQKSIGDFISFIKQIFSSHE